MYLDVMWDRVPKKSGFAPAFGYQTKPNLSLSSHVVLFVVLTQLILTMLATIHSRKLKLKTPFNGFSDWLRDIKSKSTGPSMSGNQNFRFE